MKRFLYFEHLLLTLLLASACVAVYFITPKKQSTKQIAHYALAGCYPTAAERNAKFTQALASVIEVAVSYELNSTAGGYCFTIHTNVQ